MNSDHARALPTLAARAPYGYYLHSVHLVAASITRAPECTRPHIKARPSRPIQHHHQLLSPPPTNSTMFTTPQMIQSLASAASSAVSQLASGSTPAHAYAPVSEVSVIAHVIKSSRRLTKTRAAYQSHTTLALSDYDASPVTGFMPTEAGLARLPAPFDAWECALDLVNCGHDSVLSLGEDTASDAVAKRASGEQWRESIRKVHLLDLQR